MGIDKLKVGAVLSAPILDPLDSRIKLLASGIKITQVLIDRLKSRQVDSVILTKRDIAMLSAFKPQGRRSRVPPSPSYVQSTLTNDGAEQIDELAHAGKLQENSTSQEQPIPLNTETKAGTPYSDGLKEQWATESDQRIDLVINFFDEALESNDTSVESLHSISNELIDRMVEDVDALVGLATCPFDSEYPSRHGVHIASLAIAIGSKMDLDRAALMDLSVGCLIHDVGMQAVGVGMFDTDKPLGPRSLRRLADHPVKAIEIATKYGDLLSIRSRMVLYQIHERCDGSGYPRGRKANQIHTLAKIAAVADAFIGMVSKRKHRLAIQGYHAVRSLMTQAQEQKFDPLVIRALLQTASLHPIGSLVKLNNHQIGRVIRSGGDRYVEPTIEMWDPRFQEDTATVIDLRHEPSLRIQAPLPAAA